MAIFSKFSALLTAVTILIGSQSAFAQTVLKVQKLRDGSVPTSIVPDKRPIAENGIPDGRIAKADVKSGIAEAWYSEPTAKYRHGALGDDIEARALRVRTTTGRTITYRLGALYVFEDLTPRLADMDGDGRMEVITIRASMAQGAAVTIYQLRGDLLSPMASTPFIGRPNRWLNIAGIGRFTGSRTPEIAFVDRPHLRGEMKLLQLNRRNQLLLAARLGRFTNHINGDTEQRLSAVVDYNGDGRDDLVLPSFERTEVSVITFTRNGPRILAKAKLPKRLDKPIGTRTIDGKIQLLVGLEDGSVYTLSK